MGVNGDDRAVTSGRFHKDVAPFPAEYAKSLLPQSLQKRFACQDRKRRRHNLEGNLDLLDADEFVRRQRLVFGFLDFGTERRRFLDALEENGERLGLRVASGE